MLLSGQTVPNPNSALEVANQAETQSAISLDAAYNGGTSITADSGAIAITNSVADSTGVLQLTKSPAGAQTGSALEITHNANASDPALKITAAGVGTSKTRAGIRLQESDSPSGDQYSPAIILQSAYLDGSQSTQNWRIQAEGDAPVVNYEHRLAFGTDTETWFHLKTDVDGFNVKSLRPFSAEYDSTNSALLGVFRVQHPESTSAVYGKLAQFEAALMTSNVGTLTTSREWVTFRPPTLAATVAKNVQGAYTVYIQGAPIQGTNVTLTDSYALYVNSGQSYFGGDIEVAGNILPDATGTRYLGGTSARWEWVTLDNGGFNSSGVQFDAASMYCPSSGDLRIVDSTGNGLKLSGGVVEVLTAGLFSPLVGGPEPTALTVKQNAFQSKTGEQPTVLFDFDAGVMEFATGGGTLAAQRAFKIDQPSYSATTATLTITNAATVYIGGEPLEGTNVLIGDAYALWIDSGNSRFDGDVLPGATGTYDLGSSSLFWEAIYLDRGASNTSGIQFFGGMALYSSAAGVARIGSLSGGISMEFAGQLAEARGALLCDPDVGVNDYTAFTVNQSAWAAVTIERPCVLFNFDAAVMTFDASEVIGTPTLAAQRAFKIDRPTYAADDTLTITDASTVYIENAPAASGGNLTITNAYALFVDAGVSRFDGDGTYIFQFPNDSGDPTSGGTLGASGQIPVKITGVGTRYLPFYS